ncbi:cytochrome c oxidase assembly protein [Mycobacterium sp. NPDC048908]|uniref:cytochrome c oxidase assembly protein n=1 Tax=Mycobacterium sp. NPDC048908 TaxID=3364292 RepID=UPI00371D058B
MEPAPLTWSSALTSWQWDSGAVVLIVAAGVGYGVAWRRRAVTIRDASCFAAGLALLAVATMSFIGVYDRTLFWVRALQVLMLLFVVPFFVAMGRPVTAWRLDRWVATPAARVAFHPATTSVAMLATPWLLYLTPWYPATLHNQAIAAATRVLLLLVGFAYYYARLQTDPVPRRYSQLISLVISIVESIGDGLLGIVLWLGPVIAADHYAQRPWGPSTHVDQAVGAGILWLVGDALGVVFIIVLMRFFSADERQRAAILDAEVDAEPQTDDAPTGLWWHNDPQLRDRLGRA